MSINTDFWTWPQWTMMVWLIVACLANAGNHGKPVTTKIHNGFIGFTRCGLILFLLIAGGFFK